MEGDGEGGEGDRQIRDACILDNYIYLYSLEKVVMFGYSFNCSLVHSHREPTSLPSPGPTVPGFEAGGSAKPIYAASTPTANRTKQPTTTPGTAVQNHLCPACINKFY